MPTLWSQTLIPTARQDPAEAEVPSHRLMLRAGLIRQLGAGLYTYLPAGWRALHKAIEIVRQEMDAAGAAELLMPALEPIEIFADTKRDLEYGESLLQLEDRAGRRYALAPTHEEVITEAMRAYIESYRQLPLTLYQIQPKYRDEPRPRFGVLRSREFIMKDAYSFHLSLDGPGGLDETYDRMYRAYCRIFDRCGLPYEVVEAESGPIGGSASHEFMVICDTGEDTILKSDRGDYAANVQKCAIGERSWSFDGAPTGDLDEVHTPDCATIDDVCRFLKCKPSKMLKTLVYEASFPSGRDQVESRYVVAVVRGDHDVNPSKLRTAVDSVQPGVLSVDLAPEQVARQDGFAVGYVGPHALLGRSDKTLVFVDRDAAQGEGFWVTGANKADHHVRHFNWNRELLEPLGKTAGDRVIVADVRNARDGDPSPTAAGGTLTAVRGIEVGHVFKLGTKYSDAMGFTVSDKNQRQCPVIMGCYGIGLGRILAAAIETSHDQDGIIWPPAIAPYSVHIVPIKFEGELCKTCLAVAERLEAAGIDVLIDDRAERPGVKFKDADLLGCPVRLTIGDKALAQNSVEFKRRGDRTSKGDLVKLDAVVEEVAKSLSQVTT